jgi:hypothetical protein
VLPRFGHVFGHIFGYVTLFDNLVYLLTGEKNGSPGASDACTLKRAILQYFLNCRPYESVHVIRTSIDTSAKP